MASVIEKWPNRGLAGGSENMNNQDMTKNEKETKLGTKKESRGKERNEKKSNSQTNQQANPIQAKLASPQGQYT